MGCPVSKTLLFNGKGMAGEGGVGGSQVGLAWWLLAGLCSLDLLLSVSPRVLLPLWSLQRLGVELVCPR